MNKCDYKIFYTQHKNKKRRIITYSKSESSNLKKNHESIKYFIEENTIPSKFAYAYKKKTSIYKNAKVHMWNDFFIKLDIKSFFESINLNKLSEILEFELNKKTNVSKRFTKELVSTCSLFKRGLPIGFITSPILGNLYLKQFDSLFYGKLKEIKKNEHLNRILYTRYADDLTISFKKDGYINQNSLNHIKEKIKDVAERLLKRYFLILNEEKTKLINLYNTNHVRITGISVTKSKSNERNLSTGRNRIRKLYIDTFKIYKKEQNQNLSDADILKIKQIKGMHSFILSVQKNEYDSVFSENMKKQITDLGFDNLSSLINFIYIKAKKR